MDSLLNGISLVKRKAIPDPASGNVASTTTAPFYKITHALGKLAQAGVVDDSDGLVISLTSTTSRIHSEKITHVANQLTNAGLASNDDTTKPTSHGLANQYIIIIAIVSAVVLFSLLAGGYLYWRSYKRRRAYNMVGRGVDKGEMPVPEKEDIFNADLPESETLTSHGPTIMERNFENAYDKVDTEYDGTGYRVVEEQGDKRAKFEA